jgi:hypothetical protein
MEGKKGLVIGIILFLILGFLVFKFLVKSYSSSSSDSGISSRINYLCEHKAPFKMKLVGDSHLVTKIPFGKTGELTDSYSYTESLVKQGSDKTVTFVSYDRVKSNFSNFNQVTVRAGNIKTEKSVVINSDLTTGKSRCIDSSRYPQWSFNYVNLATGTVYFNYLDSFSVSGLSESSKFSQLEKKNINGFECGYFKSDSRVGVCFSKEHCAIVYTGGNAFNSDIGLSVKKITYDFLDSEMIDFSKIPCDGSEFTTKNYINIDTFVKNSEAFFSN